MAELEQPVPPGRITRAERKMIFAAIDIANKATQMPITRQNIALMKKDIEALEKLYDEAVEESNLGLYAVWPDKPTQ